MVSGRQGRAVAVVAAVHDLALAGQFADRLLLLAGGRVAAEAPAAAVLVPEVLRPHHGARLRVLVEGDGARIAVLRGTAR